MSVRYRITHTESIQETTITYRADITDAQYSGNPIAKLVDKTFFDWEYEKIDERNPFEKPIQKSSFTINLLVRDAPDLAILQDILDANENRFKIKFYIDGKHKWSGIVLTDLLEYSEGPYPFTAQIKAKDTSSISGIDYDFVSTATLTRLSVIIAECLKKTGLTLPIRSFTNLTNSEISGSEQDFLFALYHQKSALREQNAPMSCQEALGHICRAYNLIIRQADARWIIEQLPAVAKGDDLQFDYDADGQNPVASTPARQKTIDRVDSFLLPSSQNKITGALKSATSHYNHRVLIQNIPAENVRYESDPVDQPDQAKFSLSFESDGDYRFALSVDVQVRTSSGAGNEGTAYLRVRADREGSPPSGPYYLDNAGNFSIGVKEVEVDLPGGVELGGDAHLTIRDGGPLPPDVTSISIVPLWAAVKSSGTDQAVEEVLWENIDGFIYNQGVRDWGATVSNRYSRTGKYSVTEDIPETVLGDGPTSGDNFASKGRPATGNFVGSQVTPGNFKIRGESDTFTLEELTLRERVSMRRSSLRNIRVSLWAKYSPEQLIDYDGSTWFFLGGRFQANSSTWDANILLISYSREAGDTLRTIVEEGGDPENTGTAAPSRPGGGGGITDHGALSGLGDPADHPWALQADLSNVSDWGPADGRFLNEAANLGDLPDAEARGIISACMARMNPTGGTCK